MSLHHTLRAVSALVVLLLTLAASAGALAGQTAPASPAEPERSFAIRPAPSAITVDGSLDEAAWDDAVVIDLPYEFFPGDNTPSPVRTECRAAFGRNSLYFGCTAHDPEPARIRAHFGDRDRLFDDDHLVFLIDPFDDQRRAFQFRVNPLGVQTDAVFGEGLEDFSWDAIWRSAGRVTDEGYVVEVAIPLTSLRFPRTDEHQSWRIIVERSYPRSVRHRFRSAKIERNAPCVLCRADRLTGLHGVEPGNGLELSPTLTTSRTDRREVFPAGPLVAGGADLGPGLDMRWGISPNVSLNATLNPDFSQVEADVAQLAVNERFALFFPEKRPFFMEGSDLFQSPLSLVFTRTIVDPDAGLKLTGKEGAHAFGVFAARDRVNTLLFPSNRGSRSALLEEPVSSGVVRYRRDLGQSSTLGVLYTGRSGASYHNHVAGVDGAIRLSGAGRIRFQYALSDTDYPDSLGARFGQSPDAFRGGNLLAQYAHNSRNWNGVLQYQDVGTRFRSDAGFVPRADVQGVSAVVERLVWGRTGGWFSQFSFTGIGMYLTDQEGNLTDQLAAFRAEYHGPMQSLFRLGWGHNRKFYNGEMFDLVDLRLVSELRPSGSVSFRLTGRVGDEIDIVNARDADVVELAPGMDVRLGRHLNLSLNHTLQRLYTPAGAEIYDANLTQARVVYNFNARALVRAMLQYQDIRRSQEQYTIPVEQEKQNLLSQLLFSYKVNPQTVLFLGYSDSRLGETRFDLVQGDRTVFLKLGYALRL